MIYTIQLYKRNLHLTKVYVKSNKLRILNLLAYLPLQIYCEPLRCSRLLLSFMHQILRIQKIKHKE